jgi:hypothetical protein
LEKLKDLLNTAAVSTVIIGVLVAGVLITPILIGAGVVLVVYVAIKVLHDDPDM